MNKKNDNNNALELVVLRNAFYRDSYRRAAMALLFLVVINCLLGFAVFYKFTHPPTPQYFAITPDGRMINVRALSDPAVTDNYVLQWSANAVRQAFSMDFIHWREQLQSSKQNFTGYGWTQFLNAVKKSNNLETLRTLNMVSDAKITGAPKIIRKQVINGTYAWGVEMPILVTFTNGGKTIPMPMDVNLIVMRVPVKDYPDKIAINNFLPKPTAS